jgi:hypothetical protein
VIWIAQDIKVIALELELYYLQQKRAYLMLRQDPWEDGIPMHIAMNCVNKQKLIYISYY